MDWQTLYAIIAMIVIAIGVIGWIIRLEWRVRVLEKNPLLTNFEGWTKKEGIIKFLNEKLSQTDLERNKLGKKKVL